MSLSILMFIDKPSIDSICVDSKLEKDLVDDEFLASSKPRDCVHWFDGLGLIRETDF